MRCVFNFLLTQCINVVFAYAVYLMVRYKEQIFNNVGFNFASLCHILSGKPFVFVKAK